MKKILVILLAKGPAPGRTEGELLTAGRHLAAGLSGQVEAAVFGIGGPAADAWAQHALAHGAARVLEANSPQLEAYQPDLLAAAAEAVFRSAPADVILFPGTTPGLEIAPLFAHKISAAVVVDSTELLAEDGAVRISKPVYGGKAVAGLTARQGPLVVAMRLHAVAPEEPQAASQGQRVQVPFTLDAAIARSQLLERQEEAGGADRLEEARIIVSGGRGMGAKENFSFLEDLARELGAALGASRAACDLGWVPASWQIGQTGKKVAPDLYLAVGISGASQHMVGVGGARHIVAVNKDPKAPIFQLAELGVVEDYRTFIPALTEALKQRKRSG
jgi:electron transfer flavoprotein alpha subunit